jgi:hypothetical protein
MRLRWSTRSTAEYDSPESQELVRLPCKHIFHVRHTLLPWSYSQFLLQRWCIDAWFEEHSDCPLCKKAYTPPSRPNRLSRLIILNPLVKFVRRRVKGSVEVWLEDHMTACPVCHEDFVSLSKPLEDGRVKVAVSTIPPNFPERRPNLYMDSSPFSFL